MSKALTNLVNKLEATKKELQKEAEKLLVEAFKEAFEKHPDILAFKWIQYTPFFNDGEPCEFGLGDLHYMDQKTFENIKDMEEEITEDYLRSLVSWNLRYGTDGPDDIYELAVAFHGLSEVLEIAFGDHKQVTVTRENIYVDSYEDHD